MPNKASLDNILKAVLSVANAEQSSTYPPSIFERHFNIVTSFLLDAGAKIYPTNVDMFLPFMFSKKIGVTSGYIQLPDEYRNLLGAPNINVNPEGKDCTDPVIIDTEAEFKVAKLKAGCKAVPIEIVNDAEWAYRTTSTYAFPTYENPIGVYIGERRIKLCPYDLAVVEVNFYKKENICLYGYITQPDDTFIFDPATSVESQWTEAAAAAMFRGCLSLYSAYASNSNLIEFTQILEKAGLF